MTDIIAAEFEFPIDRARAAISTSRCAVDKLVVTQFGPNKIKQKGTAGKLVSLPWNEWTASRIKAAKEEWKYPTETDIDERKKKQPYEVGAALSGGVRAAASVDAVTWICLDFDKGVNTVDFDAMVKTLHDLDLAYLVTESSSSGLEGKVKFHAYIQIKPLTLTGPSGEKLDSKQRRLWVESTYRPAYHIVTTALRQLANISAAYDPSACDVARAFFVARTPPEGQPRRIKAGDGQALDFIAAATALHAAGVQVSPELLRKSRELKTHDARPAAPRTDGDGLSGEGGFHCLHSDRCDAQMFLDLVTETHKNLHEEYTESGLRVLSNRPKLPSGERGRSRRPVGMDLYFVAQRLRWLGPPAGPRSFMCLCPCREQHSTGRQAAGEWDSSTVLFLPDGVDDPEAYTDPPLTLDVTDAGSVGETAIAAPAPTQITEAQREMMQRRAVIDQIRGDLAVSPSGQPRGSVSNAVTALANDPRWAAVLRFNAMSSAIEKVSPPSWHQDVAAASPTGDWADEDDTRLTIWLDREYGIGIGKGEARDAVRIAAEKLGSYHPVRDYLDKLPAHDGTTRMDNWLTTYLGVASTAYSRAVGRWWLISAVARAYQPGCKVDTMLILEGKQGARKSQALKELVAGVGRSVFADTEIEWGSKDRFMQIRGTWIYEVAELAGMSKHDSAKLKAFLSSAEDTFRAPYGRGETKYKRGCVFCGSVNPDSNFGYLRDATGNRRFWPVAVSNIDIEAIRRDRDQLWAEAVAAYRAGSRWWPETDEEKTLCDFASSARATTGDPWLETVAEYIAETVRADVAEAMEAGSDVARPLRAITVAAVLDTLGLPKERQTMDATARVTRIMAELKMTSHLQRVGGKVCRHYVHAADAQRRRVLAACFEHMEAAPEPVSIVAPWAMKPEFLAAGPGNWPAYRAKWVSDGYGDFCGDVDAAIGYAPPAA